MADVVVTGGNPLSGEVAVLGAKNAVLKHMVAALLAPGAHRFDNVPGILDVELMGNVLRHIGASTRREGHSLHIEVPEHINPEAPLDLVRRMRASIIVMGALIARCGAVRVALPGGDDLGARPIDMHVAGLRAMGAEFRLRHGILEGSAPSGLHGAEIRFDYPSVGATENALLGAVLARGESVIDNAAREPELVDLADYLVAMGARIEGAGTSTIRVVGVGELAAAVHEVVPDRIEAGTYAVAAAITGGEVRITACRPVHLRMELEKLAQAGCRIEAGEDWCTVTGPERPRAVTFATLPYPGFATDMHPPIVALLAVAEGTSVITENVYEARFRYIGELTRMGADIATDWQHATIKGVAALSGCPVVASDIRAGAALVLAGLRADGQTMIGEAQHIDRGYEDFDGRLRSLGADIVRLPG